MLDRPINHQRAEFPSRICDRKFNSWLLRYIADAPRAVRTLSFIALSGCLLPACSFPLSNPGVPDETESRRQGAEDSSADLNLGENVHQWQCLCKELLIPELKSTYTQTLVQTSSESEVCSFSSPAASRQNSATMRVLEVKDQETFDLLSRNILARTNGEGIRRKRSLGELVATQVEGFIGTEFVHASLIFHPASHLAVEMIESSADPDSNNKKGSPENLETQLTVVRNVCRN